MRATLPLPAVIATCALAIHQPRPQSGALPGPGVTDEPRLPWHPDWKEGSFLSCIYGTDTNLGTAGYGPFIGWRSTGHVTPEEILKMAPRKVNFWRVQDYTAKRVRAEFEALFAVLNDLVSRVDTSYWVEGGALIGAMRHRSLLPWDTDGDFCLRPVDGRRIGAAYNGSAEFKLWDGARGAVYGRFTSYNGSEYIVSYTLDDAEVLIFSLSSGLKIEMDRQAYGCDKLPKLVGRGRWISLGSTKVMIPDRPYTRMQKVRRYNKEDFGPSGGFAMPMSHFSRCSVCPSTQRDKVCGSRKPLSTRANTDAEQYVFSFLGRDLARWTCTQSHIELPGCADVPSTWPPLMVQPQFEDA